MPHTGAMVALHLPKALAARLALPEGEPADELHVTLAFLGRATDLSAATRRKLERALGLFAAHESRLKGEIGGLGMFPPDPDGLHPLYAPVDIPGGNEFRSRLVGVIESAGAHVANNHGWAPHLTLKYCKGDLTGYRLVAPVSTTFSALYLHLGDDVMPYPLSGADRP